MASLLVTSVTAAAPPANVEPASLKAGATGSVTVTFTTTTAIPDGGTLAVTFPTNFDLTGLTLPQNGICADANGDAGEGNTTILDPSGVSGQTVTITYTEPGSPTGIDWGAGIKTCTFGGVTNPTAAGSTGTYSIATSAGDSNSSVAADTIVAVAAHEVVFTTKHATATIGTNVTFVAEERDKYGNPTPNSTSYSIDAGGSGSGTIDASTGEFKPTAAGTVVINASSTAKFSTTTVTVSAASTSSSGGCSGTCGSAKYRQQQQQDTTVPEESKDPSGESEAKVLSGKAGDRVKVQIGDVELEVTIIKRDGGDGEFVRFTKSNVPDAPPGVQFDMELVGNDEDGVITINIPQEQVSGEHSIRLMHFVNNGWIEEQAQITIVNGMVQVTVDLSTLDSYSPFLVTASIPDQEVPTPSLALPVLVAAMALLGAVLRRRH